MIMELAEIGGLGEFDEKVEKGRQLYLRDQKVFLVVRPTTIEVRTDEKLRDLLEERYESVMESRYFGKGGIEIVLAEQLSEEELEDLIRLSYNLTGEKEIE